MADSRQNRNQRPNNSSQYVPSEPVLQIPNQGQTSSNSRPYVPYSATTNMSQIPTSSTPTTPTTRNNQQIHVQNTQRLGSTGRPSTHRGTESNNQPTSSRPREPNPVPGYPLQILKQNRQLKEFEWDFDAIEKVIEDNNAKESNLAVVSITGAVRKGKSFFLNFLLRYLEAEYEEHNSENWLGNENASLTGFSWRGGSERHTHGIWIWSKIYKKRMANGDSIGIILMDTQGAFDSTSTMKDNVMIFSLTSMLSSTHIYNLFNNIGADDLLNLQLAIEHGKIAMEQSVGRPFQSILFLVRDWSYPYEQDYGFEGGRTLLSKNLEITEDQDEEQAYIRRNLVLCFKELDCFLMAAPGNNVNRMENFSGQLKDLDIKFKENLEVLVPALLAPQYIRARQIGGNYLKGKNFKAYINVYWEMLKQGGATSSQTILGATAEANNLSLKSEAFELYKSEMLEQTAGKLLSFHDLVEMHLQLSKNALNSFTSKAQIGDDKQKISYYYRLNNEMENQFMLEMNEAGRLSYKAQMQRKFLNENEKQANEIETLKNIIDVYRRANDEDKLVIRGLINNK